jgi:hypothetical protein
VLWGVGHGQDFGALLVGQGVGRLAHGAGATVVATPELAPALHRSHLQPKHLAGTLLAGSGLHGFVEPADAERLRGLLG